MKDIYHFFERIGIDLALMLAGLFGGVAFVFKPNEMTISQKLITIVTGILVATYLTPLTVYLLNLPNQLSFGIAFLLGHTGLKSVEFIIKKYEQVKKIKFPKE